MAAKITAVAGAVASVTALGALGMAASTADPASNSTYNVVGEPVATSVANSPTSGAQSPDAGTRPTPGAPGVVTVVPTRVG